MKRLSLTCLAALFILTVAARAEPLRTAVLGDPDTLDPVLVTNDYAGEVIQQLFTALTEFGSDGRLGGGVATSWTVSEDGRTYTFTLGEGLTWSDGHPLTADDFVRTVHRILDPATASQRAPLFYEIEGARAANGGKAKLDAVAVKALSPTRLEITLEGPNPEFPSILTGLYPYAAHAFEAHGAQWVRPEHFTGNGPYVLKALSPNVRADLAANPRAPAKRLPKTAEATAFFVTDQPQSLRRYAAGDFDMVIEMWPSEFDRVPAAHLGERKTFEAGVSFMIGLNQRRAPLGDPRVRKALSMAIDRRGIAEKIVGGGATPANLILPGAWTGTGASQVADPALEGMIEARRAGAVALLRDAGYTDDRRPEIEILYAGDTRRRIAIALQGMWRGIGVDAKLRGSEVTAMYNDLQAGDYSVALPGFDMGNIRDALYLLSSFEKGGFFDFDRVPSPDFDAALDAARAEADPAARRAKLAKAEAALLSSYDILPLYFEPKRYLIRGRITGLVEGAEPLHWRALGLK